MTRTNQPAPSGSFLYPKSPAYDGGAGGGAQQTAQPNASGASLLYPARPSYDGAPPQMKGGDAIQRFALGNPPFTPAQTVTRASVPQSGRTFTFIVPHAPDGSAADMALDVSLSPVFPVDEQRPTDADGWGALSLVFDPPSALVKPMRSGTPIAVTPRWSTSDERAIDEGRAQLVCTVRATRVQGA